MDGLAGADLPRFCGRARDLVGEALEHIGQVIADLINRRN
jgi:hypothetical protein